MDRRQFVVGTGAAVGLAMTGAVGRGTAFATPAHEGFAVGQRVPNLTGPDQYDRTGSLRSPGPTWTLLDVSALWCQPCLDSATQHLAFTRHLNDHGIPFRMLTIIVETDQPRGDPTSDREDADRWSSFFGLEREQVLHCAGDRESPLRWLAHHISVANGQRDLIPCYLLVGPDEKVRFHTAGFCLNDVQAIIGAETGVALHERWEPVDVSLPFDRSTIWLAADVTARTADGVDIAETAIGRDDPRPPLSVHDGLIFVGSKVGDPGFDVDTPIIARFRFDDEATGFPNLYRLTVGTDVVVAEELPDGGHRHWSGTASVVRGAEDITLTARIRDIVADATNERILFDLRHEVACRATTLMTAILGLADDVRTVPSLDPASRTEALELIEGTRVAVVHRDFDRAARLSAKVPPLLHGSDLVCSANAMWVATALERLADLEAPAMFSYPPGGSAAGAGRSSPRTDPS